MKIKPLAFDSMGARAMALSVESASGVKIIIDPGVSYAPRRYGLPPHPLELERVEELKQVILDEMRDADLVIISHYHRDHYLYHDDEVEAYRGKTLVVKDYQRNVNPSQRVRAYVLFKKMRVMDIAKRVVIADSNRLRIEDIEITFSKPVPHGAPGTKLGYVVMTLVDDGSTRLLHTSDVQGPICDEALRVIEEWKPTIAFVCGPPTYFSGFKVPEGDVKKGLENLARLARVSSIKQLVVDHHLLRDLAYRKLLAEVIEDEVARKVRLCTAAEFAGRPVDQLEARRKELWEKSR